MRWTLGLLVVLTAVLTGCQERAATPPPPVAVSAPPPDAGAPAQAEATEEACVDRWLEARKLDPYGRAEGTMYAGGSPLFDERTGETQDRLTFVYAQHPEARTACAASGR